VCHCIACKSTFQIVERARVAIWVGGIDSLLLENFLLNDCEQRTKDGIIRKSIAKINSNFGSDRNLHSSEKHSQTMPVACALSAKIVCLSQLNLQLNLQLNQEGTQHEFAIGSEEGIAPTTAAGGAGIS
jgi:hypothetical protein